MGMFNCYSVNHKIKPTLRQRLKFLFCSFCYIHCKGTDMTDDIIIKFEETEK